MVPYEPFGWSIPFVYLKMFSKEIPTCNKMTILLKVIWQEPYNEEHDGVWKMWWNKQYAILNERFSERVPRNTPSVFLKLCPHITNKYATYENNRAIANLD